MRNQVYLQRLVRLLLTLALLTPLSVHSATYQSQVSSSAADAKTYGSNMETGAANALVGHTGDYVCDYLARFENVTIPQGATIDSAFLSLRCYSTGSGEVCDAVIYFEGIDSASQFSTYTDYSGRALTSSHVHWDSLPAMSSGLWYRTPNVSATVAEVVNRTGWSSGNALAVFVQDDGSSSGAFRRWYQYDGLNSRACSLIVYYDTIAGDDIQLCRRRRGVTSLGR